MAALQRIILFLIAICAVLSVGAAPLEAVQVSRQTASPLSPPQRYRQGLDNITSIQNLNSRGPPVSVCRVHYSSCPLC